MHIQRVTKKAVEKMRELHCNLRPGLDRGTENDGHKRR
jgi:hypothetical protein